MKKLFSLLIVLLAAGSAAAQNTLVTATVTDSDSIAWANGTINFQLVNPSSQIAPTCGGTPMTQAQINVSYSLDGTGSITSQPVCSTSSIVPATTEWRISICSNTSAPCQTLTAQQINGGTLNLTSTISAQIIAIRLPASPSTRAYGDVEIQPTPTAGGSYYNVTTNIIRVWNGSAWTNGTNNLNYPAGSGIPIVVGGASWGTTITAPVGNVVGDTDTQTLTNKTIDGVSPATMAFVDPTSSIQTQLNGKAANTGYGVATGVAPDAASQLTSNYSTGSTQGIIHAYGSSASVGAGVTLEGSHSDATGLNVFLNCSFTSSNCTFNDPVLMTSNSLQGVSGGNNGYFTFVGQTSVPAVPSAGSIRWTSPPSASITNPYVVEVPGNYPQSAQASFLSCTNASTSVCSFVNNLSSAANCSSSAAPAVCAAASSGSVVVAAAATTVVVNTTAVTSNSQIILTFDASLGTKLGVTCNTTYTNSWVSARVNATSFTITVATAPTTNPACFSYTVIN